LLTARQRARHLSPTLGQDREVSAYALDVGGDGVTIAANVGAHRQVFVHGEMGEDAPPLGAVGDTRFQDGGGLPALDLAAVEDDASGAGPQQSRDRAQGR